jgi:hypothetical protein
MKKKLLKATGMLLMMMIVGSAWGQGNESFTNIPTTSPSSYLARSWTGDNSVTWTAALARTDQTITGKAICWGTSGTRNVISPTYSGGMGSLTFKYVRGFTSTSARSLEVYVNSILQASITVSPSSDVVQTFTQDINVSGDVIVEIRSTGAAQVKVDDVSWVGYSAGSPVITLSQATLAGFSYINGSGPSGEQSFTVEGSNLTNDIVIAAPTNYEISETSGSGYTTPITLTQSGGTVNTTTIYVRLKAGLNAGDYNSEDITANSTDATEKTVTCSGTVFKIEPTNHVAGFTSSTNNSTTIDLSWTENDGAVVPDGYLIIANTGSITDPVDGTDPSNDTDLTDGSGNVEVAHGATAYSFTNCSPSTTYNFKIFPYTNSGTAIDFKITDAPFDDATTNAPAGEPGVGDLIITEVSGDGVAGTGSDDGYMEIYNNTSNELSLANVSARYYNSNPGAATQTINLSGSIAAGGFVIVTQNAANFLNQYGITADFEGTLFYFNGGDDGADIYHSTNGILDQFNEVGVGTFPWNWLDTYSWERNSVNSGATLSNWTQLSTATPKAFGISTWTGTTSSDWTNNLNWTFISPTSTMNITIPSGMSNYPTISAAATCNNITIEDGATLLGENNLTVNGTATVQKSITGYTGATDGWNVISAPVSGMAMAGSDFVPVLGEDDFYAYDQAENLWRNYQDGTNPEEWFDNFDAKTGYLVAYAPANAGTKNFVGALNSDASYVASLSNSNTSWNLIGNPYPSNITWADVTKTAASSAKVLNNSTGSWDDIGTILATGQGLFVYAEGGSSSVTFELGDQTHTAPAKKAETVDQIKFIADFGGKSVSLALVVNESASQSYEWQYDSRYLYPVTTIPYLCAITEDHVWVSKYAFGSQSLESTVIPLYFKVSEEQQITFGLESFTKEIGINRITLEDKVANKLTDLSAGDVYLYTANPNDETDRFVLHVETVTSIDETTHPESVLIYSYGNRIYLRSELKAYGDVTIYNLLGQNVYNTPVDLNGLQSFNLNLNKGWYVVQVVAKQGVKSIKVFIN